LTPLYAAGLALRELRLGTRLEPVRRLHFPVVSIGNLSTGGVGKTPLTIALAKALTQCGLHVDVLSRGYGRRDKNPARVDPDGAAEEFGDEPLLIAQEAGVPIYVAAQRYEAGLLAETDAERAGTKPRPAGAAKEMIPVKGTGFSTYINTAESTWALAPEGRSSENSPQPIVHLLDDGFQHRQLHRDVNILLLNRQDWTDSLLPAGNLREPLQAAHRATVLAIPASEPELEAELKAWGWTGPVWRLRRSMELPAVDGPVAAFCGIARPAQFFAGLEAVGVTVALRHAFRDHYRYTPADLKSLAVMAHAAGATALLTTEKDRLRIGKLSAAFPELLPLKTVRLRVEIEHADEAIEWLAERLRSTAHLCS
jgi:tetraacyldisaccharide 4'-kinase